MKKGLIKGIVIGLAVVLLWFANGMLGNPVSALLARKTAEAYLAENFADTDCYIDGLAYSFKDGSYYAHIASVSSMDTRFTLYITMTGKLRYDTYDSVTSGFVTANRLNMEYGELADTVFEDAAYPYGAYDSFAFGTLEIYPPEGMADPNVTDIPFYAMDQGTLILDHVYDVRALGRQAGHLVVYVDSDMVSAERAAEIMLDVKNRFDAAEIPFAAMTLVLGYPRTDDGAWSDEEVRVEHFVYGDIYEDGLTERVKAADAKLKAYYAEMDAMYKK